jgi:hypothetical protein
LLPQSQELPGSAQICPWFTWVFCKVPENTVQCYSSSSNSIKLCKHPESPSIEVPKGRLRLFGHHLLSLLFQPIQSNQRPDTYPSDWPTTQYPSAPQSL